MSAEATGWVWKNSPYTGAQLLVHLAIADVVNDVHENELWMSVGSIATKAKVARSTVSDTLLDMCGRRLIERLTSGKAERKPSRYKFLFTSPLTDITSPESGHITKRTQENPIVSASPHSGHVPPLPSKAESAPPPPDLRDWVKNRAESA